MSSKLPSMSSKKKKKSIPLGGRLLTYSPDESFVDQLAAVLALILDERHIDAQGLYSSLSSAVEAVRAKAKGATQFSLAKKVKEYDALRERHARELEKLKVRCVCVCVCVCFCVRGAKRKS